MVTSHVYLQSPLVGQLLIAIIVLQLFECGYVHLNLKTTCDCPYGRIPGFENRSPNGVRASSSTGGAATNRGGSSRSSRNGSSNSPRKLLNEVARFQGRPIPFDIREEVTSEAEPSYEELQIARSNMPHHSYQGAGNSHYSYQGAGNSHYSAVPPAASSSYASKSSGNSDSGNSGDPLRESGAASYSIGGSPRQSSTGNHSRRDIDKIDVPILPPFEAANEFRRKYLELDSVRNPQHPEYSFQISENDMQQLRNLPPPPRQPMSLKRFIIQTHPRGIGVILGIGRNPLCLELLAEWHTSPGLYLIDPFIHIWKGYDHPANVDDIEHQRIFEDLRNKIHHFQPRYSLVRDFSTSFAVSFMNTPGHPPPPVSLLYIDNNPDVRAVLRDISDWIPVVIPGGIVAGSQYDNPQVQLAVHTFAGQNGMQVGLFEDGVTWYMQRPAY